MSKIHAYTLQNNLRIFVYPDSYAQKVALQMWYGVGSKDERSGERGLAHLLEHMIFKGTQRLSESDINLITHRLSGYTNAFTSHDFTGYLFDFPKQYWTVALDLFADCMVNCTFKPDLLNSELKAVIQELKMYKDDYLSSLTEEMTTLIFDSHPYHYPIIGYKQDLCDVTQAKLLAFYKKHYVPNNAVLIVVGDVDPDEVHAQAQRFLGNISASPDYKKQTYPVSYDIKRTQITLKRDIEQPMLLLAWQIPGASAGKQFYFDIVRWIIAQGNGSRLHKKLVEELQLATNVDSFVENLSDQGLFFVRIYPRDESSISTIVDTVVDEIRLLQKEFCTQEEIQRATHQVRMGYLSLFENPDELAYVIGQTWFATGDVQQVLTYLDHDQQNIVKELRELLPLFSYTRMHQGSLLAMSEDDENAWLAIQEEQDSWDEKILLRKERVTAVEPGSYVDAVSVQEPSPITMPQYESMVTQDGLTLIISCNNRVDKIDIVLDMRAKPDYDPDEYPGLANFTYAMLKEGCKQYPGQLFMQAIESHGMVLEISTGMITLSVLKEDVEKGLELLHAMLKEPLFDPLVVEKIRARIISELNEFWDTPSDFASHLADAVIYKGHPFSHYYLGTCESINRITTEDIRSFWQQYGSPDGAYLAIVGALDQSIVLTMFDRTIAHWQGARVAELVYPPLTLPSAESVQYLINRDQTVLCIAGLSVDRMHKDYDALLIFDQILTGGMLGSMSSRLFQLREQTGLFYTIGGSVVLDAGLEPGMVMIKTIVSLDRLQETEKMIKDVLSIVPETLEQEEILAAKNAIINTLADALSTNMKIAQMLIFLARYELDVSYITKRAEALRAITADDIQAAAQRILNPDHLVVIKVGRNDA